MTAAKSSFTELPTIDISDLACDDLVRRQAVADAIGQAAREVGFFYVTGHGIAPELIAGVRAAAKEIFALPMERKMAYYIGQSKSHKATFPKAKRFTAPASRITKRRLISAFRPPTTTRSSWRKRR
jgi:isopenicillin N synthase-like dioxygenase